MAEPTGPAPEARPAAEEAQPAPPSPAKGRAPGRTRAARVAGVCVLLVVAIPAFAGGIYAVAAKDLPENLPAWLGVSDGRVMGFAPRIGFTAFGVASCLLGAAALALALALIVWPEKALAETAPLGRAIARIARSPSRRRSG